MVTNQNYFAAHELNGIEFTSPNRPSKVKQKLKKIVNEVCCDFSI